jgi:hypothetical protein
MHVAVLVLALLDVNGYVSLRGIRATGTTSWLEQGWGRLDAGLDRTETIGDINAGLDLTPSRYFDLHASGNIRHDPHGDVGGIIEAYADARLPLGLDELRLRAGQFFLPTSRENKDANWASPYTISFSALNSWIGQEVRPIGADLEYRHITAAGHALTAAATAFQGNDTMGTQLAWRGWSVGDRLTAYDEVLPLPLPRSNGRPHFFPAQRTDGTKPFGTDLDGRTGYAGRLRYSVPERGNMQYTYVDNRGDRELYRGEYAWATKFHLIGTEIGDPDKLVLAAEYMRGKTGMGSPLNDGWVDADFYAAYVLVSGKRGRNRLSARYDSFDTEERDFSRAETNTESGRSWTAAWMYDLRDDLRLAAEVTWFHGDRPPTPDPDARSVTLEARYRF